MSRVTSGGKSGSGRTLIEAVYHNLKNDVIQSRLAPSSKLLVESLRAKYEVSSSTMREALLLLVSDGLATSEGQRGFRVAPMSLDDLSGIIRLRKTLESMAITEAIKYGDDEWEANIVGAFHRMTLTEKRKPQSDNVNGGHYNDRNKEFHDALVAASPSPWLHHFRTILFQASERYRIQFNLMAKPRAGAMKEHKAILDATLARDAERASLLTVEHIDKSFRDVTKRFQGQGCGDPLIE